MKAKVKPIFGNIETILGINQDLLKQLEGLIPNWDDTVCLGSVFLSTAPFLKMYTVYSNQYNEGLKLLNQLMEEQGAFFEEIEKINAERMSVNPVALRLEHLLIMPIQRVPRYNLLLTDLIKKTPPDHPDFEDLNKALLIMKDVATHINKSVETHENLKKITSSAFTFKGLMEGHRKLIHDGVLSIQQSTTVIGESSDAKRFGFLTTSISPSETQKFHFFLFNDRLIFAPEKDVLRQKELVKADTNWPLTLVWVQPGRDDSFRIIGPNMVFFVMASPEEKSKWVSLLNEAITTNLVEANQDPISRVGLFEFPGGSTYDGAWAEGRMTGYGTFSFCGNIYEGNWLDSQKDGEGKLRCVSGEVYEGHWRDNLPQGEGYLIYPDGSNYKGNFDRGMFHESGVFQWANGDSYTGTFQHDLFSGNGTLAFSDGSMYIGEFKEGRFHGNGTLTLSNGYSYKGQWKAGVRSGTGVCHFNDGSMYEGEWAGDCFHGKGKKISGNGTTYDGHWAEGKMEGKGVLTSSSGVRYSGKWRNGVPHGKGEIRYENGDIFTGAWREGRYHGQGLLTRSNNVKLDATWSEGRLEGKLTLTVPTLPPIRAFVKGEKRDLFCQIPSHPGPVFFDLPPEIPRFDMAPIFFFAD